MLLAHTIILRFIPKIIGIRTLTYPAILFIILKNEI